MRKKPKINNDAPFGWFLAGTHPFEYTATLDSEIFHSGSRSCKVKFKKSKRASGWTTLMQNMSPEQYLGKRLRMKFWIRSEDVGNVSGWMRVDGTKDESLAFDNMCDRAIEGSHDWIEQEIILDIPDESTNIGFGVIFSGKGTMWVDEFTFQTVDKKTPTTSCPCSPGKINENSAKNLDFESDEK